MLCILYRASNNIRILITMLKCSANLTQHFRQKIIMINQFFCNKRVFITTPLILFLLLSTVILTKPLEATTHTVITAKDYSIVLNLSGKQRMLTQKMIKETLLVSMEIEETGNRQNLRDSIDLFLKTLNGLKDGDTSLQLPPTQNSKIRDQLDVVKILFDELEPIFTAVINGRKAFKEELYLLKERNIPLLLAMNKAVKMYERESKYDLGGDSALNIVINLAGKQRMLTQKMTKEFLFIKLDCCVEMNKMALIGTIALFDKTLIGLQYGDSDLGLLPTKLDNINSQLNVVQNLWDQFKIVIDKATKFTEYEIATEDVSKVAELNVPLLVNMDKVVKMYEALAQ